MQISGGSEGKVEPRWRLVWCHERVHKNDNHTHCRVLMHEAKRMGGATVLLKKGLKFGLWLERNEPTTPYFLLTDWRETQPVMALLEREDTPKPASLMLMCDSRAQRDRASRWSLKKEQHLFPMIIFDKNNIPPALLNGLIYTCFSSEASFTWAPDAWLWSSSAQADACSESNLVVEEPVPSAGRTGEGKAESSDKIPSAAPNSKVASFRAILGMYELPCHADELSSDQGTER